MLRDSIQLANNENLESAFSDQEKAFDGVNHEFLYKNHESLWDRACIYSLGSPDLFQCVHKDQSKQITQ